MADKKISQLPSGGSVQNGDLIPIARGSQNYTLLGSVITSKQDALGYTPVNKAGDTMTGNLSVPKISVGTTNTPALDTVGEGLTAGPSLAGVTQTSRRVTSRIGNAEIRMHITHLHSATSWIKNLFCLSKGDTETHVSVASGDTIAEDTYAGRYQSGGTGAYYDAVSIKKKIGTGTVSGTSMPGKFTIEISPNGSVIPVEVFSIDSNGGAAFGGAITEAPFVSLATDASGTTDIGAVSSNNILLTGSNNITSFGVAPAGTVRNLRIGGSGGSQITYNQVSMITPNGRNLFTSGNDSFQVVSLGSGNWFFRYAWRAQAGKTSNLVDASTVSFDLSLAYDYLLVTTSGVGATRQLGVPTKITINQEGTISVRQDSTGSKALIYAWCYIFPQNLVPILSLAKGSLDILSYKVLTYSTATVTMTIGDDCVVTWNGHGLVFGQRVAFTTNGTLPTGILANTGYYVEPKDANSFYLYATQAGLQGGIANRVDTSGSQSGVHTATNLAILISMNANNGA